MQAAKTKYYQLSGLNNRNPFSHSCESFKSEILVPILTGSGEDSLPALPSKGLVSKYHHTGSQGFNRGIWKRYEHSGHDMF